MADSSPFTEMRPLRVAVVGAGPSGFYVLQALLREKTTPVSIDLLDRQPAPYGLVRYGVAPDHPNIKAVTKVYDRLATDPRVRYFGGVEVGRDLGVADLAVFYDAVVYCTGAQTDRHLGVPGEDLAGSHPATAFVAWYNGHPDFGAERFDLDCERAVVVGVGNVALDVARMLVRTPDELRKTDVADDALAALTASRVREVVILGRRGPAQAAFTVAELEELAKLEGADARTKEEEVALDALSRADLQTSPDRLTESKLVHLQAYAKTPQAPKPRSLWIRFLVSPVELLGDDEGRVRAVRVVRNSLVRAKDGSLRPLPTPEEEVIEAGLVFRAVGYRGVEIPGVPFREDWGTVPNDEGRVLETPGGAPVPGFYVAGWIKRGPSGVIGTNRPDAQETVNMLLEDVAAGRVVLAPRPDPGAVVDELRTRGVHWIDFPAWQRLDAQEVAAGRAAGRPRRKLVRREDFLGGVE